jgi:hypothetical protein
MDVPIGFIFLKMNPHGRMKSTQLTVSVANLILFFYILYAIFYVPFSGTLVSGATGLMAFGLLGSYEAAVALTILAGIFFALMTKRKYAEEGFTNKVSDISQRVLGMKKVNHQEPGGVFASSFVEGFESQDASGSTVHVDTTVASPSSNPAPTNVNPTVQTMTMPSVVPPGSVSPGTGGAPQPAAGAVSSGFRSGDGKEPEGLFKLGAIPEDTKGGFHIDQGTTVMNALNALKPDQIQQMSADTQKLIDTQKSLMGMLSTVKPMMQDGKQMMDTFQEMFGGAKGAQPNPF